jgi:hypothetical protein
MACTDAPAARICRRRAEASSHDRAIWLAPGHDLEAVVGEGRYGPGEKVAGMTWRCRIDRVRL